VGRDISASIGTRYGLDVPGDRIPAGARFSALVQTGPGAHPTSYAMGTASFLGIKRPGRGVDHPPHLAPMLNGRAVPLLPLWAFVACSRVNVTFTFTFAFTLMWC